MPGEFAPKRPVGRPTKFTPELAARICAELSTGKPMTIICDSEDMPNPSTVWDWTKNDPAFSQDIARARDSGYDRIAQDALNIADETGSDTVVTQFGPRPDKEWIMRSRLRVETRLKLLAKWDPKRYGERITQEISGPDGGPVKTQGEFRPTAEDEAMIIRIAEKRDAVKRQQKEAKEGA